MTAAAEMPEDLIDAAANICRGLGIASTPTNCFPIIEGLKADRQRDQWQPIETAPKDGNWIVLHSPEHALPEFAYWDGDEFATGTCGLSPVFTHWQPLPAAPKGGAA